MVLRFVTAYHVSCRRVQITRLAAVGRDADSYFSGTSLGSRLPVGLTGSTKVSPKPFPWRSSSCSRLFPLTDSRRPSTLDDGKSVDGNLEGLPRKPSRDRALERSLRPRITEKTRG